MMFEDPRLLQLLDEKRRVRKEIAAEFGSGQICGSKELAMAIQKVNAISPFLELSEEGLINLVDLAFEVSLMKEESRYPRFQIYVPPVGFRPIGDNNNGQTDWIVCFDPPIALDASTLHRMSSGILSRPYALCVWESEETIEAYGVIRIEKFNSRDTRTSKHINVDCYSGLILSIEEPGLLNVSLSNNSITINEHLTEHLTLRYGKIGQIDVLSTTPMVNLIYTDIAKNIEDREQRELSSNICGYIDNVWSYILSLAVDFRHGGQFIILQSGSSLDEDKCLRVGGTKVLQVKHTTTKPDLGAQIALLDKAAPIQRNPSLTRSPYTGEKMTEETCDSAFKKGLSHGLRIAKSIQDEYEALFDSARAVAKLSTADGCLVFDRGLRLLGFKGEVLVRGEEDPKCVVDLERPDFKQKDRFDINKYGTRHRSAARFCGSVPGAVVFVVSQDGDIRLFRHKDNEKVEIGGPFYSLPGLSPPIMHS